MIHKKKTKQGKEKIKKLTVKLFHEKRKRKWGYYCLVASPVGPVGWGIHTALGKLHQIFRLWKASGQT
jgi:hypothetical protein